MTTTAEPDLPLSYPFPPGPLGTPPPLLAWARKHRPVCPVRLPSGDIVWMITRKTDITRVLTDSVFSRDLVYEGAPRFVGDDFTAVRGGIFNLDPPDHGRVRQVISRFYTRTGVERFRPLVRRNAARLLDAMESGLNPADLVAAYSAPLPLRVSCDILQVPVEHRSAFHSFFRAQTNLTITAREVSEATRAIGGFTAEIVESKRRSGGDDGPIGALIQARADGDISEDELQGTVSYLLVTGSDPLVSPLGAGVLTLLVHRRQLDEVLADGTLWPKAVEEILRYHHNGVLGVPRVALKEVTLHGVTIREGDGVSTPMLGATWDPAHYPNPSVFNIHRRTDGTATFGAGPHFCLGASLTRMFLRVAYQELFDRFPGLMLAMSEHDVPWEYDVAFTRPASLPVAWTGPA
ncbi:cytochrome P450 [Streptomyces sp. NPDC014894]|uniref:cytochrome P450 n=1 Tax=unclassified Streptomyces TaxID=2593676 RepID=UPI003702C3F4